jgi:hypothetical protein
MKKKVFLAILASIIAFCFIGCGDDDGEETPTDGKILKVTGIPMEVGIKGAAILGAQMGGKFPKNSPVAGGYVDKGNFTLLKLSISGGKLDLGSAWDGAGNYFIVLSTSTNPTGNTGDQYFYTDGADFFTFDSDGYSEAEDEESDLADYVTLNWKRYNIKASEKTIELKWDQFAKFLSDEEIEEEIEALLENDG